ncbi:hypothetical protein ACFGVL_004559, partial [Shigella sonnei]
TMPCCKSPHRLCLFDLSHPVSGEKTHHGGRVNPKQTGGISTCFLPRCDERDNLFLLLGC